MFVSNRRILFKFVVVIKFRFSVEKTSKVNADRCLWKTNPVEKYLFLVNNHRF